jgi:preprotein translocase subunit SecF
MMARHHGGIAGRLYRGDVSVNFVGRQRMWYAISGLIVLISVVAVLTRGLNFSMEFRGGSSFQFPVSAATAGGNTPAIQDEISGIVTRAGGGDSQVQLINGKLGPHWDVQTGTLNTTQTDAVSAALEKNLGLQVKDMSIQVVGSTWGSQITKKALEALIIFLIVIVIYLSIAFEWRMAAAAFIALIHDIIITIGVYSLTGFSVSPTSVIGLLTILGYSLYDTVVVFDKVRENTAGLLTTQRSTYSDAANLALNQTLVRSINTSLTALIPVASILFVGAGLLGAGTLKDLSLVLFVGMLSGTYSSLCIATPVLADLKEREPAYKDLRLKVTRRLAGGRAAQQRATAAGGPVVGGTLVGGTTETAVLTGADSEQDDDQDVPVQSGPVAADDDADAGDDELAVSATQGGTAPSRRADGTRSVSRQQPRRNSSAQRRPGARKRKG